MFTDKIQLISLVVLAIAEIISIVSMWKIFEKSNEKGWKALIPIYNLYILYKIADAKKLFWSIWVVSIVIIGLTFFIPLIRPILFAAEDRSNHAMKELPLGDYHFWLNMISFWLMCIVYWLLVIAKWALTIALPFMGIFFYSKLSDAFRKSFLFELGLIFLSPIFMLILAFDKSKNRYCQSVSN